jgi:hypothetical protein
LALAGFVYAETKPAPDDAPAKTGYEKAENDLFPKTVSYDGKWTVKGFSIVDTQGHTAFTWQDNGAIQRYYMIVSWSPDSQRVVLLDQFGRGEILYAAQLLNGVWRNVRVELKLSALEHRYYTAPKISPKNRVSIPAWVSITALKIEDRFMVGDLPTTGTHWETATEMLQFSNDSLRAVE